jgi:hypothetical protein
MGDEHLVVADILGLKLGKALPPYKDFEST